MDSSIHTSKTIAFCTSSLTIRMSRDLWEGIQRECRQLGYNSICYSGERLYPNDFETNQAGANIVYDFITPDVVDGVILYTADIGDLVGDAVMNQFWKKFEKLPVISIAWEIEGVPTIAIDNYRGMASVVEHMVVEHRYKRVAFVQGPMSNPEAVERYQAYCDVLAANGIAFDESLVFPGDFSRTSGQDAVHELLLRKLPIDCIVCIDDETAVGVYEALQNQGILIPDDIAVCGFDNEEMASVMNPPLTTVGQPLVLEGQKAVQALKTIWEGGVPQLREKASTDLFVRRSCGCMERELIGITDDAFQVVASGTDQTLEVVRPELESILRQIVRERELLISEATIGELIDALVVAHKSGNDREYAAILWSTLTFISKRGSFISPIQEVFSRFHQVGVAVLNSAALIKFEIILHRSRVMIGSIAERVNSWRIDAAEKYITLGDVNYILNAHFERTHLTEYLADIADRNFTQIGIRRFYLVLYDDTCEPITTSQLKFCWEDGSQCDVTGLGSFPTAQLLPQTFADRLRIYHLSVSPLFFNADHFGYILAETATADAMACDILSWQISAAFERVDLIERESERREELELSFTELKQTQHLLVEAEKMASLGDLVAGVAHEINTPIGAAVTYASYFQELVESMQSNFSEGKITKSGLEEFLKKSADVSRGLLLNLNRSAQLIRSFKEVAVDQTSAERRVFNLKTYIEEIFFALEKTITQRGHSYSIQCPEDLDMDGYPGQISQVMTNLVMNSLHHAFDDGRVGHISVEVVRESKSVLIRYSDNGKGLNKQVKNQIFNPFFTTKRGSGGSGLGMHIVYNLITQSLGGTISCESEEGYGVVFVISIPVNQQ